MISCPCCHARLKSKTLPTHTLDEHYGRISSPFVSRPIIPVRAKYHSDGSIKWQTGSTSRPIELLSAFPQRQPIALDLLCRTPRQYHDPSSTTAASSSCQPPALSAPLLFPCCPLPDHLTWSTPSLLLCRPSPACPAPASPFPLVLLSAAHLPHVVYRPHSLCCPPPVRPHMAE